MLPYRRAGALLAAPIVAILLTGCGGDSPGPGDSATQPPAAVARAPVTISGAFGSATIEERPHRVLPLSTTDADFVIAAGGSPIAVPTLSQSEPATDAKGQYPWQRGRFAGNTPKLDAPVTGLDFEAIAALKPDVIVATAFFGLDDRAYKRLSRIAPVVHSDTEPNADAWQDSARKVAKAVGGERAAEATIGDAEDSLAAVRRKNPKLKGLTFNAIISPGANGVWVLCSAKDNMARVMSAFGLRLSAFARTVDCDGGKGEVSWENLPKLEADVLWVVPDAPGQLKVLEGQSLWHGMPAVRRGSFFTVAKTEGVPFALAFPSPLSLTWAAEQLAPKVAKAAERSPATRH